MQPQNRILRLPKDIADKIAAGEVVDRPLSVVKELLENAIDAGATQIVAEIKNGGKSYIRITDNGCGIAKDDLLTAFDRHATSKIRDVKDLDRIETLGFRGEALASIAAVSEVEVVTRTEEESVGTRVTLAGGTLVEQTQTGCPQGTTIIVTNLFYNTPARLKFLKNDAAESSLILDFLSKMAIAYPKIRLRVIHNGAILFSTPGNGNVLAHIHTVYSREIGEHLLSAKGEADALRIDAYLSPPAKSRTTRKHQIMFVNGRLVKSKLLEDAIDAAYRERLQDGRHPVVILFLTVDPAKLDVNIHPNKKEVRFENQEEITSFVKARLQAALAGEDAIPEIPVAKPIPLETIPKPVQLELPGKPPAVVDINLLLSTKRAQEVSEPQEPYVSPKPKFDVSGIQLIGSLFGTYLIGLDDTTFYLIDQHAAHERVFYEKLLQASEQAEKASQFLMIPLILEVAVTVLAQPERPMSDLSAYGFQLEPFGPRSFSVKAIPSFFTQEEATEFLESYFDQVEESAVWKDPKRLAKIIMESCKSAVKGNRTLSDLERERLLQDLAHCENPFSCPHGRPTIVKMTQSDIEKLFKRS